MNPQPTDHTDKELSAMQEMIDHIKSNYAWFIDNGTEYGVVPKLLSKATSLLAKEAEDKKNEAINFALHLEKMNPINKFSVHPPAGSGGSTGLYEKTVEQLYNEFNSQV